jgi:hypothetical protein
MHNNTRQSIPPAVCRFTVTDITNVYQNLISTIVSMDKCSECIPMRKQILKLQIGRIPPYLHIRLKLSRPNRSCNIVTIVSSNALSTWVQKRYGKSSILTIQLSPTFDFVHRLQNRLSLAIQLSKLFKIDHRVVLMSCFNFLFVI